MKYCPNRDCPTLKEIGMVAEYEDHVVYCEDCGALLIVADSPPAIVPQITPQPAQTDEEMSDFGEDAALLGTFEAWDDVEACVVECERLGIPVIVEETTLTLGAEESDTEVDFDVAAFNLLVRKQDLFRAMSVLDDLFAEDADDDWDGESEEEFDERYDDEYDDDQEDK